jgi:hypothetical protein
MPICESQIGPKEEGKDDDKSLPYIVRPAGNKEAEMTVNESKELKNGTRVYWRGDAADSGIITETSWDAVTITWNNGQVASVHHGDMREIQRVPTKSHTV